MSGAPLIALWPSGFAYLLPMNHGAHKTHGNVFRFLLPPPLFFFFSVLHFLCHSVSYSHFISFSCLFLSHCFPLPYHSSFTRLSPCLDPSLCIPSCLIKACIINTAISLSIPLPRSYDCYIKCKLFRCNSLLMSLL